MIHLNNVGSALTDELTRSQVSVDLIQYPEPSTLTGCRVERGLGYIIQVAWFYPKLPANFRQRAWRYL